MQGGLVSIATLSDAVFICSQPWRQAERDARRWWFPMFLKLWARRCREMDFAAEHTKFDAYFAAETDFPLAKVLAHGDRFAEREFCAPWWWRLLAIMMAHFHLSEAAALDMPVMKAALLYSAMAEAEGKLKLWTKADDGFDAFCRDMDGRDVQFPSANN